MNKSPNSFYVTGGTLRRDAPSYVPRQADQDLYEGLRQGKFCYVLTSRQMGKSSLMVRTAARLREEGATVAILDLTRIGQNLTPEQWYDGLLGQLGEQLNLIEELEAFWLSHDRLGPLDRWMRAVREIVLPRRAGQIVIFVDEIDAVRSLPFSTDEFFAAIRECYNRRTEAPDLARLTFCLLGVATPSDLIRDTRTTPFNIGRRIELNDFAEAEAVPLAEGLGRDERTARKLLRRIFYWTGGHPYLTQRLCQAVAENAAVTAAGGVDRLCEELFFTTRARERDDNLLFVRERMLRSEGDLAGLLDLYAQVRRDKRVRDDETNPLVSILQLSGITRVVEGLLSVRNRIYERVFDRKWVIANLPDAELHRQRAAYRRGILRAAVIATVMVVAFGMLAFMAFQQRNRAEEEARRADNNLRQANSNAVKAQAALAEEEKQRKRAEDQEKLAKQRQAEAEQGRREAIAQQKIAIQQRFETERERERANQNEQQYQQLLIEFGRQPDPFATSEDKLPVAGYKERQTKLPIAPPPTRGNTAFKPVQKTPVGKYKRITPDRPIISSEITIGITLWRLRPPMLSNEEAGSTRVKRITAERITPNTPLFVGDRLGFSIETTRLTYLYVINRARYADGTFSDPHLIFPINGENNRGLAGRVTELALGDNVFILLRNRPDQIAEEISVIATTEPIRDLQSETNATPLIRDLFEFWKKSWELQTEQLEFVDETGRTKTRAGGLWPPEMAAESVATNGTKILNQSDPLPSLIYRSSGKVIMATIPLRISK